ncbi:MAG: hypothetical protein U0797_21870 [Gemmataceae bacterium]
MTASTPVSSIAASVSTSSGSSSLRMTVLMVTNTLRRGVSGVGVGDDFGQLFQREVLRLGAGGELLQQVDGVGPEVERGGRRRGRRRGRALRFGRMKDEG